MAMIEALENMLLIVEFVLLSKKEERSCVVDGELRTSNFGTLLYLSSRIEIHALIFMFMQ